MLDLQLLVEELLQLHKPLLRDFVVDLSIAYSEKSGRIELSFETADTGRTRWRSPRARTISRSRWCAGPPTRSSTGARTGGAGS
jgi:hypothetical protein